MHQLHARVPGRHAFALLQRYGAPVLVLSWVPLIGDVLVALAGAARVPFARFSVWVIIGKASRYLTIAWILAEV